MTVERGHRPCIYFGDESRTVVVVSMHVGMFFCLFFSLPLTL